MKAADGLPPGDPATTPLPAGKPWQPGWCAWDFRAAWLEDHHKLVEQSRRLGPDIEVLIYGDSIAHAWGTGAEPHAQGLRVANYSIPGDSTRQLLYRIADGEVAGLSPRLVVVAIGTNNLFDDVNGGSAPEVAQGVAAVLSLLRERLPHARIVLCDILPRGDAWVCDKVLAANRLLSALADGDTIQYVERYAAFAATTVDPTCGVRRDLYRDDLVHLNEAGVATFTATIGPAIRAALR